MSTYLEPAQAAKLLKADGHPAEPKLREIRDRLSEILAPIHQAILSETNDGSKSAE
jgi:hypothetical protein